MSMTFSTPRRVLLPIIVSGFVDDTAWMRKVPGDPTIRRAKFPETLRANDSHEGRQWAQRRLNVTDVWECLSPLADEIDARFERLRAEVAQSSGIPV